MRVVTLSVLAIGSLIATNACDRPARAGSGAQPATHVSVQPAFDVNAVVARVSASFRPDGERFVSKQRSQRVRIGAEGVAVQPLRRGVVEAVDEGPALRLAPSSVRRGATPLSESSPPRLSDDGTVIASRGEVTEIFAGDRDGIEQSWSFEKMPSGVGDVDVEIAVSGLEYAGQADAALRFTDPATGLGVRYGAATWVDARGHRSSVEVQFDGRRLRLRVPESVIESSVYPAVLDPRISAEIPLDNPVLRTAQSYQEVVAIASDGTNFLVVWADSRANDRDIWGARVSPSGVLIDPTGFPISSAANDQYAPSVVFAGSQYVVAWEDTRTSPINTRDIYAARVSLSGVVLDPNGITVRADGTTNKNSPVLAFDGTNVLCVWDNFNPSTGANRLNAARISSAGLVLDPSGILVPVSSPNGYVGGRPAVAFDGSNYLISWWGGYIYATFMSPGATFLGSPFAVTLSTSVDASPVVAFDGTNYLVAWTDYRNGSQNGDIYATRVTPAGSVLNPSGIAVTSAAGNQNSPRIAFNGTNFLVVWRDERNGTASDDIYAARVTPAGVVLDGGGIAVSSATGEQAAPAVAAAGNQFFVTWFDPRAGTADPEIYGTGVDTTGAVLSPAGVLVSQAANVETAPRVAFDGTNYLVVWQDSRSNSGDIYATRVTGAGVVLDPNGIAVSTANFAQISPAVAFNGSEYLVVWTDLRGGSYATFGARVGLNGVVLDPSGFGISQGNQGVSGPAVASDGANFFVVWANSSSQADLYGKTVSAAGVVGNGGFNTNGLAISTATGIQQYPSIAFDGTNYLVVWEDRRNAAPDVYGARVTVAGTVLDPSGFAISAAVNGQTVPTVAFDGTNYLVAWQDNRNSTASSDVYAARVTPGGQVIEGSGDGAGFAVSTAAGDQGWPSVAFDGTQFVVAWEDRRNGPWAVYGARINSAGTVQDPTGLSISGGSLYESRPALAGDGTGRTLVTYVRFDPASGLGSERVKARLITPNAPPQATPQTLTTAEDQSLPISLSGTDTDNDPLTFAVTTQPTHGTLSGAAPNLTYTPNANYNGADSFTFIADDGADKSGPATVAITVSPVNDAPVAQSKTVTTAEDTPLPIILTASDTENDPLTMTIVAQPSHGTLTGSPPSVTYVPAPNYFGSDSFTFTASDGSATSAPASIAITVSPVNDPPTADAQQATTNEDVSVSIVLSGADVDGDPLIFTIASQPGAGTLSGTPPNVTYTPAANATGTDSFTFTTSDGSASSAPATVTITVNPVNDPPTAIPQTVSVTEDTPAGVVLSGSDVDGDPLTFAVVSSPAHGTLSGAPPNLTYVPDANFSGTDSFVFTASDASTTSTPATVTLAISPVNDAPVAVSQSVSTAEDTALTILLSGTDPENDPLQIAIMTLPAHGTLSGVAPNLTYTPAANFNGIDSFTFTANDGSLTSAAATVSIDVSPVQDAPVATPLNVTVVQGKMLAITLSGTDADGDSLSFAIQTVGTKGAVTGTPPAVTYTPPGGGFRGKDTFTFTVSDGLNTSAPATVSVNVTNAPPTGNVSATPASPLEGEQVQFTVTASDPGGDALTYLWNFGDGATATTATATHAYAAAGQYMASVEVSDGVEKVTGKIAVTVRDAAPTIASLGGSATGNEGEPLSFAADVSDFNPNTVFAYEWDFGDGSAPATSQSVTHAWRDDGTYTVRLTVFDSEGASSTKSVDVVIANVAPVPNAVADQQIAPGTIRLQLQAIDPAGDLDPLTWTLVEGPGAVSASGEYVWDATAQDVGPHAVHVRVADDGGASADLTFQIEVEPETAAGCSCSSANGAGNSTGWIILLAPAVLLLAERRTRRIRGLSSPGSST